MSQLVSTHRNERGIALGTAIFALVIIGALVAGALFVGVQEQRVGRNTIRMDQAFDAAQEGAQLQVANWFEGHPYNSLVVGDSATFNGKLADSTGWYRGAVRKLNSSLYLVRSEGFSADNRTRQQVGMLVRLKVFELDLKAAIKTRGATNMAGSATVDGNDRAPTGWACDALLPSQAGVKIGNAADLSISCNKPGCITGTPPVLQDTTLQPDSMLVFGDYKFDDLKAMATKVYPAATYSGMAPVFNADGSCNTGHPWNWGDPLNPSSTCGSYYPIILFTGTGVTKMNGGRGQGIILVEGDLKLTGSFDFYGPVIVKGTIETLGNGNTITGGVIAANSASAAQKISGNSDIKFSSCALLKALQKHAPGYALRERSWVQLY